MHATSPTDRTKLRRMPERGSHDRPVLDAILDEGIVCHVGFVDGGMPIVIPTGYVRDGDRILLHGSRASRMMKALAAGQPVCVTVTHLDGLVLAKSGFNHSMNYRSAVVFGKATPIPATDKLEAMRLYMERLLPGRWDDLRPTNDQELAATEVVALSLDEASAKVRTGPPKDEAEDLDWPVWSGVIPLTMATAPPQPDATSTTSDVPDRLASWSPARR